MEYLNGTGKVLFRRREKGLGVAGSDGMARQSPSILKLMPMDALASLRTLPAETWFDVYRHGRGARRFCFPRMEGAGPLALRIALKAIRLCARAASVRQIMTTGQADGMTNSFKNIIPAVLTHSPSPDHAPASMKRRRLACSR